MTNNTESEGLEIIKGFLLLMFFHTLAGLFIFVLGFAIEATVGGYNGLAVWLIGSIGFLFWQLLYVIPLLFWLKRRRKRDMMKGVAIGAVVKLFAIQISQGI